MWLNPHTIFFKKLHPTQKFIVYLYDNINIWIKKNTNQSFFIVENNKQTKKKKYCWNDNNNFYYLNWYTLPSCLGIILSTVAEIHPIFYRVSTEIHRSLRVSAATVWVIRKASQVFCTTVGNVYMGKIEIEW